jgi:hypothetical protein
MNMDDDKLKLDQMTGEDWSKIDENVSIPNNCDKLCNNI